MPLSDDIEAAYQSGTLFDGRRTGTAKAPKPSDGYEPGSAELFPDLAAIGIQPEHLTRQRCRALMTHLKASPKALGWQVGGRRSLMGVVPELRGLSNYERAMEFSRRWAEHLARKSQAARPVQDEAKPLKQADVDFSAT
jgi:hypothetical protein